VHIYRLVSVNTIEENILKKSDQKRHLDLLAIQSGGFNTDSLLQTFNPREILGLGEGAAAGKALTERDLNAVLREVEDEEDAAAEAAAEAEAKEEEAEFTAEPPREEEGGLLDEEKM
jgi:hypothetical protein